MAISLDKCAHINNTIKIYSDSMYMCYAFIKSSTIHDLIDNMNN
jgi:hypothetical protein